MNQAILQRLKANSRMSWQQIGKQVHLTGQAVAARVLQLEEQGVITGYTIRQANLPRYFITVFMENSHFDQFEVFLKAESQVECAYKTTGEGCYHVVLTPFKPEHLELFLNALLRFGQYKVASAIRHVK